MTPTSTGPQQNEEWRLLHPTEEIYGRVAQVLAESLNVEKDDLRPAATLQGDLGAESIDFLDILFRLEREFGIKIPRAELFPDSLFQGNPAFVQEGKVMDLGMRELRARMPYADLRTFDQDRGLTAVPNLYTVDLVARYVTWKLSAPTHKENGR